MESKFITIFKHCWNQKILLPFLDEESLFLTDLPILPSALSSNVRNIWSANSLASPFWKKLWYMLSNCGLEMNPSGYSLMNFWNHFSSSFSSKFVRLRRCMSWWGSILLCFFPISFWGGITRNYNKTRCKNLTFVETTVFIIFLPAGNFLDTTAFLRTFSGDGVRGLRRSQRTRAQNVRTNTCLDICILM